MNLLLDTHILIWALNDDPQLSEKAREMLRDAPGSIQRNIDLGDIHKAFFTTGGRCIQRQGII